jgi:hypothetical protein
MKFAKIVFWGAGIWGVVTLAPLYFILDMIGRQDPPAVTHPLFFYGFVGVALAWQFVFFVIAKDPVRFRLMMIPSVLEKLAFGIPALVLYTQRRLSVSDLGLGCIDLFLGVLFLSAFRSTAPLSPSK